MVDLKLSTPWGLGLVLLLTLELHCQPSARDSSATASGSAPVQLTPYPPGSWRQLSPSDLARQVLWASHILVRYDGVPSRRISLDLPEWQSATPPPKRSRDEALQLALQLELRARANPASFAQLARTTSEDVATRDWGGSLGGVSASRLLPFPLALDALFNLAPGEVSRVVETIFGFHVFLRREPPVEQTVSGARIVIAHDDTTWLRDHLARDTPPPRSRQSALALASAIYERARDAPEDFPLLVEQYSEHRDATRGGDFGAWSSREATPFAHEVETLLGLQPGEVAPPFDSLFGYQIVQRTAERVRQRYSMDWVEFQFDPALPASHPRSRAATLQIAEAALKTLLRAPERLAAFHEKFCCKQSKSWLEGRGPAPIEALLATLQPGQIGGLVQLAKSFVIVKRLPNAAAHSLL